MKKMFADESLAAVIQNNNGLKHYLVSLTKGRDATPRSWLYEDLSPDEILAKWNEKLAVLENGTPYEQEVYRFDVAQTSKYGPQGKVAPIAELMDEIVLPTFIGYASEPVSPQAKKLFSSAAWKKAKALATAELFAGTRVRKHSLRPYSYDKVTVGLASTDKLETNSGFPEFTRRSKVTQEAIQDAESGKWKEYPAIILFRNYNQKTRPVWMMPMSTNLVEASFANPIKDAIQASSSEYLRFFCSWKGYSYVQREQTIEYARRKKQAASDFSHTDENFHPSLTLEVYDVIKHFYQPQFHEALKESLLHMHNIPLLVGENELLTGQHGVASGSVWTNDVETYFDFIWAWYLAIIGVTAEPGIGIGDDILWLLDQIRKRFPELLSQQAALFGAYINSEKVTNDKDKVKYLQRLVQPGYFSDRKFLEVTLLRGVYSTIRALKSLVFPERFHSPKLWSKDMFAVRVFMILENCIDHPLFTQFVDFVCDGHPYLREFARKKAEYIDEQQAKSKVLPGLNATYNQEKRDQKMSTFASVRIAARAT